MRTTVKVLLVTLLIGIPAFLLAPMAPFGPAIWPAPAPLMPAPTPGQVTLLMVFGALEAAALGLGVAFVILGWPLVRRAAAPDRGRAMAMYLSTAWLLVNWWLHDGLHMVSGMNPRGLVWIEWGFHGTLIVAGAALAYCFARPDWEGSPRRVR
jgi:hypothetical protein